MEDFEKILIAVIVLALVAVIVADPKKNISGLINTAGNFLVNMVNRINGNAA
jgi:hypothetical protein